MQSIMSFEYNSRRDAGSGVNSNNTTSLPPAPSVFQPPLPPLRHGNHNQHDTSPQTHYNNPVMRSDGHFKTQSMRYHQSRPEEVDGENRSQDGRYMQQHSPRHMHTLSSDKQLFHKKSPFLTSGKGGSFDPYQRQDDARHPAEASRVTERGRDTRGKRGDNHGVDEGHYPYSREGPSPGRGYGRTDDFQQQPRIEQALNQSFPPSQHPGSNIYQNPHSNKRKSQDPPVIDGPRLISHQSSDDSINVLVQKRARNGNSISAEPNSLMKSFTPLSPMHSRSFSRDEAIDMNRFAPRSADNYRIFQSWSSGNSNSGFHSPSDVRLCYDDWQQADPNLRPANGRSWEEKVMTNREEISNKECDNGSSIHFHGSNRHPSSFHPKSSRNGGGHQQRWPSPPPHERQMNQRPTRYENVGPEKNMLPSPNSRNHCQVLHPEDRCGPYHNQLSHHVNPSVNPSAQYGRVMDVGRPFWRSQPVPQMQYGSQRRDDIEDRSKMNHVRGRPASPTSRLSAPTPPVTNGYGRFSNEFHHPNMYDMPMTGGPRPPFEPWVNRGRPFGTAPYNHATGQSNESRESADGFNRPYSSHCSHLQSVKIESGPNGSSGMRTADGILLLSLPEDRISLSETLCIVRENVEVFIATEADVKAPAPGRKRPVVEGQVGLRCIHCRSALHQSDKVKRAVCFPSSIKRIYRTVIDMKLDHFKACRFVPIELKMKLEELKATNARSTGTTMQYFVQAAKRMGMYDGTHGIRFGEKDDAGNIIGVKKEASTSEIIESGGDPSKIRSSDKSSTSAMDPTKSKADGTQSSVPDGVSFTLSMDLSASGESTEGLQKNSGSKVKKEVKYHTGKANLSLPEDKTALSPLRCFLRENVYAFSATAEDIAVRTPTTFSVVLGQVGIGCIHCHSMRAKERSNRAVCFPFSIGRIYQSVADIQRFHLGECKMVPEPVRAKFLELQSASSKGSKGLATRQYWVTSAKKLGLVDSDSGIRFSRDPSIPLEKAFSLDILAQVASDVTTAAKPLVLPEDKPHIAGFLYVVMKQLQPCRFTEADRNKRRLKDVGCIGVECKHCAGQVDGRKFFWSSVSAVESNFVSVHTHMMECKIIPDDMKTKLAHLKTLRKEQTARLKSGSQKAFFSRVWKRLHSEGDKVPSVNGQPTASQVNSSQIAKAKQIQSAANGVVPATTKVSAAKEVTSRNPKDNTMKIVDGKPSTTDISPLATYSSSQTSSPNSSLTSQNSFPYSAIKVEQSLSPDYSRAKTPDPSERDMLENHGISMETMGPGSSFITPSSILSPTPTTEDIMMRRSPFSSPSSIESSKSHTNKDVTLDPSIFSSSAPIESPTPAAAIDANMESKASGLHGIVKMGNA